MVADFGPAEARKWIAVPTVADDKYSRGVVGFITGSARYPGAAVLGVEAALHTGVGMVRYLGPGRATRLVLQRRPEAVTTDGRVEAWVLGSGQTPVERDDKLLGMALAQQVPVVIDSGALDMVRDAAGPVVLTPHAGELAGLKSLGLAGMRERIEALHGRLTIIGQPGAGTTVSIQVSRTSRLRRDCSFG